MLRRLRQNGLAFSGGVVVVALFLAALLAPLLPGAFNAARGPTKFFDFARMGAVGIYSDVAPYRGFIRPEVDGILLPNEPAVWVKAIAGLVADPERRVRMATAARERALTLSVQASRAAAHAG